MFTDKNNRRFEIAVIAELVDDDRDQVEKTRMRNIVVTGDDQMDDRLTEDFRMHRHRSNDETNRSRPTFAQFHRRTISSDD